MNKYSISDIHGCLKTFEALLAKIAFSKEDQLFLLGDFIDRGPDSKGVFDLIWKLQNENFQIKCLRGNHDQMMLDAKSESSWQLTWLRNGGGTTMDNFNAYLVSDIPKPYFDFIAQMPYYLEVDQYILVHAGFLFNLENPFEEFKAMLWQRNWYQHINYEWLANRIIIHGHTPVTTAEANIMLKNINKKQYLNIDTGCVHKGKQKGSGILSCFDLGKQTFIFQENVDF